MKAPGNRHQEELLRNQEVWESKPVLRDIYRAFYDRIISFIDPQVPGPIIEIGAGMGSLKTRLPAVIATDLFANPWLDVVCSGYHLPFFGGRLSHLVLFDVFHHLEMPNAFLREAARVISPGGRLILFEPFMSLVSYPIYAWCHPEPVDWKTPVRLESDQPSTLRYYAAQGNATRLFFQQDIHQWNPDWKLLHREIIPSFAYLLSGGFSRPGFYPASWLPGLLRLDQFLARWPQVFGARCLLVLGLAR